MLPHLTKAGAGEVGECRGAGTGLAFATPAPAQRLRVPIVERFDRTPQLVDHQLIVVPGYVSRAGANAWILEVERPRRGCLDAARERRETGQVRQYRVFVRVWPVASCRPLNASDSFSAHRVVLAPCAQEAACELASPYVEAGLVVDWTARRAGVRRFGRRWSGRLVPDDRDDETAGVREPRRPRPPAGSAAAAVEPPAA